MEREGYDFLTHLKRIREVSDHTLRNYCTDLNRFTLFLKKIGFCPSTIPLLSTKKIGALELFPLFDWQLISKDIIRQYLAYLHQRGVSRNTLLRHLSSLRSFFLYLKKTKILAHNPMEEVERPRPYTTLPVILSYEEVNQLLTRPNVGDFFGMRDRSMLELLYSSGLRVGELAALNRQDVHATSRLLHVRGKGGRERLVPVTACAAGWIERYLTHPKRYEEGKPWREQDVQAIFLNKWGNRISTRSVDRLFKKYFYESGLSGKVTPHTIRHTIATHWLERGMDLKTIQKILGHRLLGTTTLYTQVSMNLKREVYLRSHPRAREEP